MISRSDGIVARPMLFSGAMVRALIREAKHPGTGKTQTRRVVRNVPQLMNERGEWCLPLRSRYGLPDDLLWVRETWQYAPQKYCSCPQPSEPSPCDDWIDGTGCQSNRGDVVYAADGGASARWRPSIHMPRGASRLTLRITDVRVERLHNISEDDAIAEGIRKVGERWEAEGICATPVSAVDAYRSLWSFINGRASWDDDPWVWVISFRSELRNVDEVLRAAA